MAPAELERLYDAHAQALFAFVLNLTRSEPDTRDVLQEVFVKLAARPQMLDGVRDERGFLLRVAHNLAVTAMRRREARERKHQEFGDEAETIFVPDAGDGEQSFRDAVAAGMAELPAEQRAPYGLQT